MNRKLSLLICLIAAFGLRIQAQNESHYGIYFGCNINNMSNDNSLYYDDSRVDTRATYTTNDTIYSVKYLPVNGASAKPTLGFLLGGYYEYEINDIVAIQLNLLYNQYGYRLEGTVDQKNIANDSINTYNYSGTTKMSNIGAAVLLKFNILRKDMSLEVGVQPSYCFKTVKEVDRDISHESIVYDSNNEYKPFNLCGSIGLTWYYFHNFFVSARVNVGLFDVLKSKEPYIEQEHPKDIRYRYTDVKSKTNSLLLTLGYRIDR